MPFKSQAQHRKFRELLADGKITQKVFDEWLGATADLKKLPEHVGDKPGSEPAAIASPAHAADRIVQNVVQLGGRKKQ